MDLSVSLVVAFIAFLVSISATYNAYLLRGGKFAASEIMIALGMVVLMFSLLMDKLFVLPNPVVIGDFHVTDAVFTFGLVLFLIASFRLRSAFK